MASSPSSSDISPQGQLLLASLERQRDIIMNRLREANGTTEREVLAVGEALKAIVDEARAYVSESRNTLEDFVSTSVTDMLERHGSTMTGFVVTMTGQVQAQGEAAQQATEQINRIVELGRTIERVTMESKILALNANIQARRLGVAGESFQVIAQEMKHFSESVNDANKTVQELAKGLLTVLPKISSIASEMRKTTESFTADMHHRVAEVSDANSATKERVASSMAAGEARLQQILTLSYEALSHLQFQDTIAQSLLGCQTPLKQLLQEVSQWVSSGTAAALYESTTLPIAQPSAQADSEAEPALESGDVMLF